MFNSATNGKKQPQGLFAFQALEMLGYDFDAIIELSGFNEIALSVDENYKNNINPIYPRLSPQQFLGNARRLTNNFANNFIERLTLDAPFTSIFKQPNFNLLLFSNTLHR